MVCTCKIKPESSTLSKKKMSSSSSTSHSENFTKSSYHNTSIMTTIKLLSQISINFLDYFMPTLLFFSVMLHYSIKVKDFRLNHNGKKQQCFHVET